MKLIEFPEQTVVIAKDQPEYQPLPAHQFNDSTGTIACCWKLTLWERIKLLFTGVIWHQIWTFNKALQPQLLTVEKPIMSLEAWHAELARLAKQHGFRWLITADAEDYREAYEDGQSPIAELNEQIDAARASC